ncbi:PREDICTED: LOW QUALITY PROTEIN: protein translation factor SUI1 homolog, partial [Wasmannia auropunctata]|uniref:LOW QUALITY PROTEIN: protein translation factor SUI1 homolog n=1 Tax=Wasmannia auropunctata TaxID=64793 RepID=UPI0005EDC758
PAGFGNARTARNPTHRAVTNATFTSGCVHGHRAWFRDSPFRSLRWCPRAPQVLDLCRTSLHVPASTTAACAQQFYIIRGISFVCRMSIQNLNTFDPFADAIKGSDDDVQDGLVHIRIQQRNGRKTLTTVQGLSSEYDLKKIVRACKKEFACNGTVIEHPEYGEVLQLQGDQRENICQWLTKSGLAKPDQLKVHGF